MLCTVVRTVFYFGGWRLENGREQVSRHSSVQEIARSLATTGIETGPT